MAGVLGTASDGSMHPGRVEPLCEQVPVNAAHDRRLLERRVVPKPPAERLLDQLVFIKVPEHLGDGRSCHVARDAEHFNLAQCPQASMTLHVRFRSRAGQRGAAVVQGALALQAGDGFLDVVRFELAPCKARSDLRFAQLAASEHSQSSDVGAGHLPAGFRDRGRGTRAGTRHLIDGCVTGAHDAL